MAGKKGRSGGARPNTGGQREGAGRKPMHGEAMERSVFVKLTDEQYNALAARANKVGVKLAFYVREAALTHAGRADLCSTVKTKESEELKALAKRMRRARG